MGGYSACATKATRSLVYCVFCPQYCFASNLSDQTFRATCYRSVPRPLKFFCSNFPWPFKVYSIFSCFLLQLQSAFVDSDVLPCFKRFERSHKSMELLDSRKLEPNNTKPPMYLWGLNHYSQLSYFWELIRITVAFTVTVIIFPGIN